MRWWGAYDRLQLDSWNAFYFFSSTAILQERKKEDLQMSTVLVVPPN
jgi:hypothetical protein